jgi:predicted nucleic acid-binding protein
MIYLDTTVIVKLYVKEEYSREVSKWIKDNDEAIPLTSFHELEFTNAIKLKHFRKEMTKDEAGIVLKQFNAHEKRGVFFRPQINWSDAFARSLDLSKTHTEVTGSKSLDIIHVALALSIGTTRFFTFDKRQSELASVAGLRVETGGGFRPSGHEAPKP